jgi:hypothetical protein
MIYSSMHLIQHIDSKLLFVSVLKHFVCNKLNIGAKNANIEHFDHIVRIVSLFERCDNIHYINHQIEHNGYTKLLIII